jgi:BNR repeat protein
MRLRRLPAIAIGSLTLAAMTPAVRLPTGRERAVEATRMTVGPNVLVSRDGNVPHVELIVAAHPTDPNVLLGGGIVVGELETHNASYVSGDGGNSWSARQFPDNGGYDPLVAFGPSGTMYFVNPAGLHLFVSRSEDNGTTWERPADLGRGYDHPQIAVDHTTGPFRGRLYIAVLGVRDWPVSLFRSEDAGRTWKPPVEFDNGHGEVGLNVATPLVLSDGTLFVPYFDYEVKPERQRKDSFLYHAWFVTSIDGGLSFSKRTPIRTEMLGPRLMGGKASFTQYAVDPSARYRDRIYSVWPDETGGLPRVMFQYSADRGKSWSTPRAIGAATPSAAWQYQPAIAVSASGVVGVTWFDTRAAHDTSRYDQYFTASTDGGKTFLPAVRVSSETSIPASPGNRILRPYAFSVDDSLWVRFIAVAGRWLQGGDYMGLTADASGIFHPFWADSRTGTFHIYTASVRVENEPAISGSSQPTAMRELSAKEFTAVFNVTRYDPGTRELSVPVQVRNRAAFALGGPMSLRVLLARSHGETPRPEDTPIFLNSTNGVTGEGAVYDFTSAIGGTGLLAAGSLTSPVLIRMRVSDPMRVPALVFRATAAVPR